MQPCQSPTHSKDSTVQKIPWTSCLPSVSRDKDNDSKQRLQERWLWTVTTIKNSSNRFRYFYRPSTSGWWWVSVNECERYSLLNIIRSCYVGDGVCHPDKVYCAVMLFVVKRANSEGICVLSVITRGKMLLLFFKISLSDATLCSFLSFFTWFTVALGQRNIFKPRRAGNSRISRLNTAMSQTVTIYAYFLKTSCHYYLLCQSRR